LFEDDNMTINMTRFEHICDEIVSRGLKFTWETPNGIRGDRVTLQLAKKMKAAGCKRVRIAIENGDQHTLDKIIRKDLDLKKALQGIQACLDAELLVDCFFIFGIPGETKETFRKTHDFALTCLKMGANPLYSIAVPLPNTALYNECVEKGYLIENVDWSQVMSARIKPIIRTPEFSPEDVVYWYNKTQRDIAWTIATHPWLFFRTNMGADVMRNPAKVLSVFKKMYNGSIKPFAMSIANSLKMG
ncbi:MAG: radical SAM protein, partial [archaeon]